MICLAAATASAVSPAARWAASSGNRYTQRYIAPEPSVPARHSPISAASLITSSGRPSCQASQAAHGHAPGDPAGLAADFLRRLERLRQQGADRPRVAPAQRGQREGQQGEIAQVRLADPVRQAHRPGQLLGRLGQVAAEPQRPAEEVGGVADVLVPVLAGVVGRLDARPQVRDVLVVDAQPVAQQLLQRAEPVEDRLSRRGAAGLDEWPRLLEHGEGRVGIEAHHVHVGAAVEHEFEPQVDLLGAGVRPHGVAAEQRLRRGELAPRPRRS